MPAQLSILDLILQADWVVKAVIATLLLLSIFSWTLIFKRRADFVVAHRAKGRFEKHFWAGSELNALYKEASSRKQRLYGLEHIFYAGFHEYLRVYYSGATDQERYLNGVVRAMKIAYTREVEKLESNLPWLATIGSVSPYIGLFGTVWGIMHAFIGLGGQTQVTLAMVAPGIAEALIATAMGLVAAIPAVIAYNRFVQGVDKMENAYACFMDEFITILNRQQHTPPDEQ